MEMNEAMRQFTILKSEHTHDRDTANNYSCFNVESCRNCNYVYNSRNCISCHNCDTVIDCIQCVDCRDCSFCVGLNGARFHILNKEYSEAEYYEILEQLGVDWNVDNF